MSISRRTRITLILIAAITILSLATVAIGPVLAQTGTGGGSTVALQSGDTLGAIVSRYKLSGDSLRAFFNQNQALNLAPGQTVTFPSGVTVNLPSNSQSSGSSSATTGQTYVTQSSDTLGQVIGFMGFSSSIGTATASTPTIEATATSASTAAATSAATAAATTAETPTTAATAAATTSATAVGTATPVATTASSSSNGTVGSTVSTPTDSQLEEFVKLNQGLAFVAGQSITLPADVAVTGNGSNSSSGTTTYTVQSGDTLQSLASKFGISLAQLLALNPNLLTPGMTINVPSSSGSIPQTGNSGPKSFTINNEETLGQIESRFGLGLGQMTSFFTTNCDLTVVPGQTVRFPIAVASPGSTGSQQFTYVTQQGDTLCALINMMGLNLSQGASSSGNSSNAASTATPAATTAAPTAEATTAVTPTSEATIAVTPTSEATTAVTPTSEVTTAATPTSEATTAATPTAEATTAATPAASATNPSSNGMGAYANNQEGLLREFLKFNRFLKLENGQTVSVGNQIPATGGNSSTTSNTTSSSATNATSAAAANPANNNAYSCDIPRGRGLYRIGSGESLTSIATRFGVTIQQILDLNPGRTSYGKGDVIFLPGVEAPGLWNMAALGCDDAVHPQVNPNSR